MIDVDLAYRDKVKQESQQMYDGMAIMGVLTDVHCIMRGDRRPTRTEAWNRECYQRIADVMIRDGDPSFYPDALQAAVSLRDGAGAVKHHQLHALWDAAGTLRWKYLPSRD